MAKVLVSSYEINDSELHSRDYIYLQTYTFGKCMTPPGSTYSAAIN